MKISVCEAINLALDEELTNNSKVFLIGEEVGKSGGTYKATTNLLHEHGKKRIIDTPISEIGFSGLAVGASYNGLIPVCEFMTWNFALQAIDHIINSSAKIRYMSGGLIQSSIVFRGPNGFSIGVGAQHTQDFGAWYGSVPGLKVAAPYSAKDHRGILKASIRDGNVVVILENEMLYNVKFEKDVSFESDYVQEFKCVVEMEGTDITLVGISLNVGICLEVASELSVDGIYVEVINLVSIRPLDMETIFGSVRKTRKIVVVDNGWPSFSIASEICYQVYDKFSNEKNILVQKINGADCPTAYAANLEELSFPSKKQIKDTILKMMNRQ